MRKRITLMTLVLLLIMPSAVFAVSEAAVIYMLIEPSSRAGAMGGAHVAQVDDGFADYWNTGAMAFNRSARIAYTYSNWYGAIFDDIEYQYLGIIQYFEKAGSFGLTYTRMSYGKQQLFDEDDIYIGDFTSRDFNLGLTYGYQITRNLGIGFAVKYIHSDLAPQLMSNSKGCAKSFAFDFGFLHKDIIPSLPLGRLDFGLSIQNLGPDISYINEEQSDPLPLNLRSGFSWEALNTELARLTINCDMKKLLANRKHDWYARIYKDMIDQSLDEEWEEVDLSIGAELRLLDHFDYRAGYILKSTDSIEGFSFGVGILYNYYDLFRVEMDFAKQPAGILQDYNYTTV